MCGLAGHFNLTGQSSEAALLLESKRMADTIVHRGPDDEGLWVDPVVGLGLAHRRLAIVDLSPAGHQPMPSESGRFVMAFNGEIYNHLELRQRLESEGRTASWRGHSDTETLLAGFETWGIEATLKAAIGMFAIALWDTHDRQLILARDRLGEKPLYYGCQQGQGNTVFLFGSELKALRAHSAFAAAISRPALALYVRHNYIPAPHSIYENIYKLQPGCLLRISPEHPEPVITEYWSAASVMAEGTSQRQRSLAPEEAVEQLETLLKSAVSLQMMADVPLGAFLSGGIDSSTIVALMQSQSSRPISTFTIGFHEKGYNEAEHAKAVAKHLGTQHTELYVTPEQAMAVIPQLPTMYDEPFSDSSQIPTYLVSQLARQHVTVSLSGDAGDELFSGYRRYNVTANTWGKISKLPQPVRTALSRSITALSPATWSRLAGWLPGSSPRIGDHLHKGAGVLNSTSVEALYYGLVSQWSDPAYIVIGGAEPATILTGAMPDLSSLEPVERMMALDLLTYLPDDILAKVDRASMATSLESRVPMLDHRVVEFAWQLPHALKQRDGVGKWILRQVLYRHVPQELIDRPKMGFGIPIDEWLRGPLRDWAQALLDEQRLRKEGYFHHGPIQQKWQEHLSGAKNWAYHLWNILMFQAWLEENHPAG
ncbi:asparagine synthase (glutamine-hydrolyzing) [Pseudomonas sp. RAC1]|uniref:asparagine synthase (glutamine-hydrolyzing) n=1 Tax=Pseudomonas sp. RAC1 TaxID=3064900 RepID=UPI0027180162|nr:asparagine synthase (glutamine-hydrolyzing) [Pseudomonas sp. RAC1]MDV9033934.1 asparagine synthase (glutamine-hydrolyzing) [Pseudomonas sp. RAC1]